ncbi:MAG: c-type cytochrome [Steroidobacteraceae bacterium]
MTYSTLSATRRFLAVAFFTLGFATGDAMAAAAGDAAAGSTKAATCTACHGQNGNSVNPDWPVLAGQNANYLSIQIQNFRGGKRTNPLMQPMVQNLTDQDVADLAAFFSAQTPTGNEADPSYWKAGEKLYRGGDAARAIPGCVACHGPVGRGNPAAGYPALQAQHAVYTIKQLNDYTTDMRYAKNAAGQSQVTANAQMMKTIAARLTPEDRRNLASYIQGIR